MGWILLALAILALVASFTVVNALGAQQRSMHIEGAAGYSIEDAIKSGKIKEAKEVWDRFWEQDNSPSGADPGTEDLIRSLYRDPRDLVKLSLFVDFVLIAGYAGAALVLLLRRVNRLDPEVSIWVYGVAALSVLVAAGLDVAENVGALGWSCKKEDCGGWDPDVLKWLFRLKSWALMLGLLIFLYILLVRFRTRNDQTSASLKLLRSTVFCTVLALVAFSLPIQLSDVILRLSNWQLFGYGAASLALAMVTWGTGRFVVTSHEGRPVDPEKPRRFLWWHALLLLIAAFVLAFLLVTRTKAGPAVAWVCLIPVVMVLIAVCAGKAARISNQVRKLETPGVAIPLVLGVSMMAIAGIPLLKGAVAAYVQRGGRAVPLFSMGGGFFAGGLLLAWLLFNLELRFAGVDAIHEFSDRKTKLRNRTLDHVGTELSKESPVLFYAALSLGIGAFLAALGLESAWHLDSAQVLGGGFMVLAFVGVTVAGSGLAVLIADWWVDAYGYPHIFSRGVREQSVSLRAIPIFTALLIWGVVAATFDDGEHWAVRTLAAGKPEPGAQVAPIKGVSLQEAWDRWIQEAPARAVQVEGVPAKQVPLVVVAASGGGIRAAYWTALVMDCLFSGAGGEACKVPEGTRGPRPEDVFLATSISGSSLGLVSWDAYRTPGGEGPWISEKLGEDFVAPNLARGLFIEIPRSFLHFKTDGRDKTLERAWEKPWGKAPNPLQEGFLAGERAKFDSKASPLLFLNGSSVFDGCSLSVSLLDVGSTIDPPSKDGVLPSFDCVSSERYEGSAATVDPGPVPSSIDLLDYLRCIDQYDVSRSSAALLSARFPYVSAAGRLTQCNEFDESGQLIKKGRGGAKFIVDGGYVDTSAAESAMALWRALEPIVDKYNDDNRGSFEVIPYFVQLDNSYISTASPIDKTKPPNQFLAPPLAAWHSTGLQSRATRARAVAAEAFSGEDAAADHYARLAPVTHPGVEANLGWTLSEDSQRDLENQLYKGNERLIGEIHCWFAPGSCVGGKPKVE